jgi:topoisomerase IA-like protein
MAKISKTVVDADLRSQIFEDIFADPSDTGYVKINDRQYGIILTDKNGVERYCRIGVIVAEEREDMTARELMAKEIAEYNAKQEAKAAKAAERAKKAEADKARREAKAKEKEA